MIAPHYYREAFRDGVIIYVFYLVFFSTFHTILLSPLSCTFNGSFVQHTDYLSLLPPPAYVVRCAACVVYLQAFSEITSPPEQKDVVCNGEFGSRAFKLGVNDQNPLRNARERASGLLAIFGLFTQQNMGVSMAVTFCGLFLNYSSVKVPRIWLYTKFVIIEHSSRKVIVDILLK